ncbi:MAG: hypothetical protein LC687_01870 [Actinobacteria bacterium]|nr:hypothetical protein [Actinomycetota bacterium]
MATNKSKVTSEYTTTVGIECHVQLKTKTKLFAAVDNDARESAPNTHISHICLGMPGALPETKNLNSFRSVEKAVEFEVMRQIAVLEAGDTVIQETRGWNEAKQKTISQRSKEEAHDYRYFPEPDIPPIRLDEAFLKEVRQNIPQMPAEIRTALKARGLTQEHIEILLEAELDNETISYLGTLLDNQLDAELVTAVANLMVQIEIPKRRSEELSNAPVLEVAKRTAIYIEVSKLAQAGSVSSTNAKALLQDLLFSGARPKNIEAYAEQQGYIQVSDTSELEQIVEAVIAENAQAAEDVQSGEMKAIGFLVGQAMKKSHGQANPALIKELLQKKLSS